MAHPTPSTQHPSSNSTPLRTPIHVACLSNLTPSTEARKAILEGDWTEVEKHCRRWTEDVSKTTSSQQKTFLYAIYREQYLELIEGQEYQKAFTHLTKRLKPLEGSAASEGEFRDLCYLLTCKSVQEVLRGWEGVAAAREQLVQHLNDVFDSSETQLASGGKLPEKRLVRLLQQAVAYQLESARHKPARVKVDSLMEDYSCPLLPNATHRVLIGHTAGVKCVSWVGNELLASGGNDGCLRLWDVATGTCTGYFEGHTGRVWDVSASASGTRIASACADGAVRIWSLDENNGRATTLRYTVPTATLAEHRGDVYSVCIHPSEHAVVTAGYDRTVRLFDVNKAVLLRTLQGHELAVRQVVFNSTGNLLVSGSKDATVRFWDARSGLCVKRLENHLGEVTSVQLSASGTQLLSSSTDNTIRLWDVRAARPLRSFKGHLNTCKSFVRADFGPSKDQIVSGSEDGCVIVWDAESAQMVQRLHGHADVAYSAVWNESQGMLASCSHDGSLRTWWYDPNLLGD
uniref:WD40 repeat-containing protein SMU1 n=2 Tax=Haptolina ericina TaxID=156174 RepID=A0A7S3C5P7_9EUKA|mmetsp:Transcript_9731/g.22086  ORF Transcript_9731/g.22086 Transcript_9731/m.22086 type:complete len:516 (+) Transcript_9731:225-1772(+)